MASVNNISLETTALSNSGQSVQDLVMARLSGMAPAAKIAPNGNGDCSVQQLQKLINRYWEDMPKPVKRLLLEPAAPVDIQTLTKFWSLPMWCDKTRGDVSTSMSGTSWLLALAYLKLGKTKEARALTLNGSFLRQCADVPVEHIAKLRDGEGINLPIFREAFRSLQTPQTMEAFLMEQLPYRCQYNVKKYVNQIGNSWVDASSTKKDRTPSSETASTETQIELILASDANKDERHTLSIGSTTTLKTLFNNYAKERGDSLRSLRFSYRRKILFLSSVGNKTPDQLNMKDQDVITVHVTGASQETGGVTDSSKRKNTHALQKPKTTKNQKMNKKKTKDKKEQKSKREQPVKTLQEWKAEHSNKLSKVHEEVYQRLKEIRIRLNALDLKCQLPKQKRKKTRKINVGPTVDNHRILPHSGIGGKAGKSFFSVQVGEVQNLYKTTNKRLQNMSCHNATMLLDLHGCTREEALMKLNEILPMWVEIAMRGSYPFVMPAKIVCGGGCQILSETVEKWIREHAQVANAMKNMPQ